MHWLWTPPRRGPGSVAESSSAKWRDASVLITAVEHLRRAQPEFSVSLMMASYPPSDPDWLEAVARAGMPLT